MLLLEGLPFLSSIEFQELFLKSCLLFYVSEFVFDLFSLGRLLQFHVEGKLVLDPGGVDVVDRLVCL